MIINVLQTQIFPESVAWYCKILMNELSQKWELLLCQSWYLLENDLTFRCCKYESIMDIVIKYIHEIWYLKLSNSVVFAKTFQSYLIKNQNDNSKKKILNPCFKTGEHPLYYKVYQSNQAPIIKSCQNTTSNEDFDISNSININS